MCAGMREPCMQQEGRKVGMEGRKIGRQEGRKEGRGGAGR